ncbi:MAG: hypothetical protein EPO52_12405 [Herbiconiux sp.]|uniref:hypothetical protein n=1 Tax=Herbiconiux sp. TaxID=1871186 RepID=UPI001202EE30|nr:hypothetical protein [Herbiconiux sp.]TAJ47297.1 MAG: hypothetical protein EPO52_12405 [Herbiconiux sp.]
MKRAVVGVVLVAGCLGLAGCSGASGSPVGVWVAPDGTSATIDENGACTNMYWTQGQSLDIGGGMTCSFSGDTLVVNQPPNTATYSYSIDGDTMTLNGSLVFTRQ